VKTTLEVPDHLMQRVKLHAVRRKQKLKDAVAELLEAGMAAAPRRAPRRRAPRPVRLRTRRPLTIADIEKAIASGRE